MKGDPRSSFFFSGEWSCELCTLGSDCLKQSIFRELIVPTASRRLQTNITMAARASSPSSTERLTFRSPNSASAYRAAPTTSADPRRCANLVFALMFGVGWVCLALFAVENMVGTSEYSWFALNLRVEYAENGAVPLSEDFTFDSIFVALFLLSNGGLFCYFHFFSFSSQFCYLIVQLLLCWEH
jgi:hypothetical protein